jgi:hypothetical protein
VSKRQKPDYRAKAAQACVDFASVLDEIQSIKPLIAEALEKCEKPFSQTVGSIGPNPIQVEQTHLSRYFENGGRLDAAFYAGEEPDDNFDSDISECPACLEAYALCIRRKRLRQKRGVALRSVRYYGRKAQGATA